jgi:hypothetical protein
LKSGALISNPFITALATLLAALAMLWHLLHFRYIRFSTDFLKKENIPLLLVCIPFVYTLMYLLSWATEWINLPNLLEETFMDMSHSIVGILSIAFAAPILEECLFRGAIEGHLLSLWKGKPWAAILVSGLAFGLVHINPSSALCWVGCAGARAASCRVLWHTSLTTAFPLCACGSTALKGVSRRVPVRLRNPTS